jgi:hypothetical protein
MGLQDDVLRLAATQVLLSKRQEADRQLGPGKGPSGIARRLLQSAGSPIGKPALRSDPAQPVRTRFIIASTHPVAVHESKVTSV